MNDEPIPKSQQESAHERSRGSKPGSKSWRTTWNAAARSALFSNVLLAGGALWLLAGLFGIVYLGPATLGAIAAILGGFVLSGSNRSTDAANPGRARCRRGVRGPS